MDESDDGTRLILLSIGPELPAGVPVTLVVQRMADGSIWSGVDARYGGTVERVLVSETVEREMWARTKPVDLVERLKRRAG